MTEDHAAQDGPRVDPCRCIKSGESRRSPQRPTRFHRERQDTTAPGWLRLLELIEEAAADGRTVFQPLTELTAEQRRQIITLPPEIAELTEVKDFVLYNSNLIRIPPEIGAMQSLEKFTPYTSYRLHWFPYEITRCRNLKDSTVSTRAIYGNYKNRSPFPKLADPARADAADMTDLDPGTWGPTTIRTCSVCDGPVTNTTLRQVWISRGVATDVLPLLVNACSEDCVKALPQPAANHIPTSHRGGADVEQPPKYW